MALHGIDHQEVIDAAHEKGGPPWTIRDRSLADLSRLTERQDDAHRRLARPCLPPVVLGIELLGDRGWGWASREVA